eukprot:10620727-Karenia_brevis.AAC.1
MFNEVQEAIFGVGLSFGFKRDKTSWIQIGAEHGRDEAFECQGHQVFASDDSQLAILNNVFQHDCFLDADTDKRISRFHSAIRDIHEQLYLKKAALHDRVKLLSMTGGAAMLWSIEST